jgi:hypothetical protein
MYIRMVYTLHATNLASCQWSQHTAATWCTRLSKYGCSCLHDAAPDPIPQTSQPLNAIGSASNRHFMTPHALPGVRPAHGEYTTSAWPCVIRCSTLCAQTQAYLGRMHIWPVANNTRNTEDGLSALQSASACAARKQAHMTHAGASHIQSSLCKGPHPHRTLDAIKPSSDTGNRVRLPSSAHSTPAKASTLDACTPLDEPDF